MKKQKEAILTLEEHQNQLLEKAINRVMMEFAKCLDTDEDGFVLFREQPELVAERINFFFEIMD